MSDCADGARLSPDERLREVAAILATGFLRLRQQAASASEKAEESPGKRLPKGIGLSGETRLIVRVG